ncbi:MAG TPA: topology modulation protein, partial [Alphaproteobacteria bacterium]|nr:topology modulation protein [Alphaproteobacteria bacterium]
MKRILIIGSSGAGKSTFSKKLAKKLKTNNIHLDHLFWLPEWKERNKEDFDKLLAKELIKDRWIMDGNYHRTLSKRLRYADTVIH